MNKKQLMVLWVIFVHVLLVIVLIKSNFTYKNHHSEPKEITEHYYRMLNYHKRIDGNVPNDAVVFIGDSLTQGLCVCAISPNSVNYGIGSDTTLGVLQRIPYYSSIKRASVIVLSIGVNDIKKRNNLEILDNIKSILALIPKETPCVISAVMPVDELIMKWPEVNKDRIDPLNKSIKELSSLSKNVVFVDITKDIIDQRGFLAPKYDDGDGIHLNSAGNAIWINELKKAIMPIESYTHMSNISLPPEFQPN